jgi:homoserine kinase
MQQVTVRVPASTSNLGPGFDCLGVALRIYNDITVSRDRRSRQEPLVREAAALFFERARRIPFHFSYRIAGKIPSCRGLGGSATIRLGIVHALNELTNNPLSRDQIFEIAAELEGHPDNAGPSEFGGFNVTRASQHQRFTVSPRLYFVLLIPNFEIGTSKARRILPTHLARLGAVKSCGNACAITAAFASRNYQKLRGAFVDHLHQPFRKRLIPFLDDVIAAAERAGALGGFLSGSGSTITCVALRSPAKVAAAMLNASALEEAQTVIAGADNRGARIVPFRNPQSAIRN